MAPKVSVIVPIYNVKQYLDNMLKSLETQSLKDFEVILIDDGSFDGTADIAISHAKKDERYRYIRQENAGVSAARNRGIEEATGEYLAFYDADDIIPETALEAMYKTSKKRNADMTVGIMEEKSLGESLLYMHSVKLAAQKTINVMDKHLFGAWSVCNKLFRRNFIIENDLRFETLKNAEDGVFTFCVLQKAKVICGCRTIAYNYIKRPFWEAASATQTISRSYMESLLSSHDRILNEAEKLADRTFKGNQSQISEYLRPLYIRYIEGELLNGYYRGIWRCDEDLTSGINERLSEYKKNIRVSDWKALCKRHGDINLEYGLIPLDELSERPLVSIILTSESEPELLNLQIMSLYNQIFPRFEILIGKSKAHNIREELRCKQNLKFCDDIGMSKLEFAKNAFDLSKGEYIIFSDEVTYFTKNTLKNMWNLLETKKLGCASVMVKAFDGKDYTYIEMINGMYGYSFLKSRRIFKDGFTSNKMFRRSVLLAKEDFPVKYDSRAGIYFSFKSISCEGIRKSAMIAPQNDAKIKSVIESCKGGFFNRINARVNKGVDKIMYNVKKYLTKDDLNRIRKRFKK